MHGDAYGVVDSAILRSLLVLLTSNKENEAS